MTDELEMIPAIVYTSTATRREYTQKEKPHLVSLERADTDIMNVNIWGPKWDYQIQMKISSFLELMKAEKMLEPSE